MPKSRGRKKGRGPAPRKKKKVSFSVGQDQISDAPLIGDSNKWAYFNFSTTNYERDVYSGRSLSSSISLDNMSCSHLRNLLDFNDINSFFLQNDWYQELFSSNLLQGSTSEVLTLQEGTVDLKGSSDVDDVLIGDDNDNKLVGVRGKDILIGGDGGDELRAGNGRDIINGGDGSDTMYGGFGLNTFEDADDGEIDQLFFKSDQHAYNWIYDKAGNSPNGQKADKIMELDPFDEIFVQGVETEELDFGNVVHRSNLGETLEGIGIYASGTLEAVYVGDNLSLGQVEAMTQGIL